MMVILDCIRHLRKLGLKNEKLKDYQTYLVLLAFQECDGTWESFKVSLKGIGDVQEGTLDSYHDVYDVLIEHGVDSAKQKAYDILMSII